MPIISSIENRRRTPNEVKRIRLIFACAILAGSLLSKFVVGERAQSEQEPVDTSATLEKTAIPQQE